jgi:PAS domain S-box-containing protein
MSNVDDDGGVPLSPHGDVSGGGELLSTDISARRQTEEALRLSQERYRAFVANSAEGIYRIEFAPPIDTALTPDEQIARIYRDGRFAECNDTFARMYGFARAEEMVGRSLDLMLPPDDATARAYLRFLIEAGYRVADVESAERDRNGQLLYFANSIIGVVEQGRLVHAWGTQRDITDRKLVEERVRESEERFRTLAATIPQLIWTARPDGGVDYLSAQWADYVGLPPEQLAGWGWQRAVHPDDLAHTLRHWSSSIARAAPLECKHRLRHRSGEWRWQLVRGLPISDVAGQVTTWVGTSTDIHDAEQAAADARLLAELAERIRIADDVDQLLDTMLARIGQAFQVTRCYIAEIDEAHDRWLVRHEYHTAPPSISAI